jgi:transcriptional regulator with XRE-family HTH domain
LREDRNLSQVALGRALGVSARSISRYEKHLRFPRESFLWTVCEVLKCELWQLFHPDPVEAEHALVWAKAHRREGWKVNRN